MNYYKKGLHRCYVCSSLSIEPEKTICDYCIKLLRDNPPKKNCYKCGVYMRENLERYILFGNMCSKCNSECVHFMKNERRKKVSEDIISN